MASRAEDEVMRALLRPWELLTDPVFHGVELLPDSGPCLFVGNHTIFGLLDLPLLVAHVYRETGLFLRGLAEKAHYRIPVWRDFLTRFGAVDGSRENARTLLRDGEAVLVLPGGGREVAKRKGERYQLIWKQRMGFARLAIGAAARSCRSARSAARRCTTSWSTPTPRSWPPYEPRSSDSAVEG